MVISNVPARHLESGYSYLLLRVSAVTAVGRCTMLGTTVTIGRQFRATRAAVAACTSTGATCPLRTTAAVRTDVRHAQSQHLQPNGGVCVFITYIYGRHSIVIRRI